MAKDIEERLAKLAPADEVLSCPACVCTGRVGKRWTTGLGAVSTQERVLDYDIPGQHVNDIS